MRILIFVIAFSVWTAAAKEVLLSDDERTKRSAAAFVGTVTSTNFLRELESGALYSAQVRVETIEKSHPAIQTNIVIYYEQSYRAYDDGGVLWHGRTCPAYPDVVVGQKLRFWCIRHTVEGHTNVLFVPTATWVRRQ